MWMHLAALAKMWSDRILSHLPLNLGSAWGPWESSPRLFMPWISVAHLAPRTGSSKASENTSALQKMARGDAGCPVLPCSMREVTGHPDFGSLLWRRGWKLLWKRPTHWVLRYCGSCSASYEIIKYLLDEREEGTLGWCLQYSEEEAGVSVPVEGDMQSGVHTLPVLHDFSCRKAREKKEEVQVLPCLIASFLTILERGTAVNA